MANIEKGARPTEAPLPASKHLRRALLGRGLVAAGALALGPRALRALAAGATIDAGTLVHAPAGVAAPPIVSRSEWGADESLRSATRSFAPITKAIVHHTVTLNDEPDPAARVRAIYRYHVGNGWDDIGYNFLIDRSGQIYEGRWARAYGAAEVHDAENEDGLGVLGAHAYGFNRGSVGVALLGTYTSNGVTASDDALDALTQLLSWKLGSRRIDPHGVSGYAKADGSVAPFANVCGHRDVLATGCPGDGLSRRLAEVRDGVAARIAASTEVAVTTSPSVDVPPAVEASASPRPSDDGGGDREGERRRREKKKRRRDRQSR